MLQKTSVAIKSALRIKQIAAQSLLNSSTKLNGDSSRVFVWLGFLVTVGKVIVTLWVCKWQRRFKEDDIWCMLRYLLVKSSPVLSLCERFHRHWEGGLHCQQFPCCTVLLQSSCWKSIRKKGGNKKAEMKAILLPCSVPPYCVLNRNNSLHRENCTPTLPSNNNNERER